MLWMRSTETFLARLWCPYSFSAGFPGNIRQQYPPESFHMAGPCDSTTAGVYPRCFRYDLIQNAFH